MLKLRPIILCYLLSSLVMSFAYAKPPKHWDKGAYAYKASATSIAKVLEDFADSQGVRLEMSHNISGSSSGWHRADSPVEFLDRLALKYKFHWYVYNNVLYVSSISDNVLERIETSTDGVENLKKALEGVGLFEEKFGWGVLPEDSSLVVSGPASYIKKVRSLIKVKSKKKEKNRAYEIMVFPLQYAAVDDRDINVRDSKITIPGVATLLNGLLQKGPVFESPSNKASPEETDSAPGHLGGALSGQPESSQVARRSKGRMVSVEADVRTNSVLVYDEAHRRDFYQKLIDQLDMPQSLVEIEAIIIDIDRNRIADLGVDWSATNDGRTLGVNLSGAGQDPFQMFANGSATVLISNLERFYASIRLMESKGQASVVANPSILTLENQPAVIDLSETSYIESVGERVANVESVTAGTMLKVTPRRISSYGKNQIQLAVDIEDGRILQEGTSRLPRVERNTISTKAVIDEQFSLVIGGYHRREKNKLVNRVPVLGSLPIIGSVFTSEFEDHSTRERLVILTPRVSDTRHTPANYTDTNQSALIHTAVEKVKARGKKTNKSLLENVRSVFGSLAREELPTGYLITDMVEPAQCNNFNNKLRFDFSKGRRLIGSDLDVRVGVVKNLSDKRVKVPESACDSDKTVAVTLWPSNELEPGESTSVFVAYDAR